MIVGESGSSNLRKITSLQTLLLAASGLTGTAEISIALPASGLPTAGLYYLRSFATNGGGTTLGATLGYSAFQAWRIATFGANAANPLIAGPAASPAGDGMSNLLKYALGLSPLVATAGAAPVMGLSNGALTLTYTKALAATDLTYSVEWSTDLTTWSPIGVTEQLLGGNTVTQQIRATAPLAPAAAKFLRLHVTLK